MKKTRTIEVVFNICDVCTLEIEAKLLNRLSIVCTKDDVIKNTQEYELCDGCYVEYQLARQPFILSETPVVDYIAKEEAQKLPAGYHKLALQEIYEHKAGRFLVPGHPQIGGGL